MEDAEDRRADPSDGYRSVLDVANHVLADRRLRVPSTYADVFEVLRDAGLLDQGLADAFVRIIRFRNILVHDYARIDPAIVVQILGERLDDFRRFREAALRWVSLPEPDPRGD